MVESQTHNRKVASSSLGPSGIVGGGSECTALSPRQSALEQGTEPPTAPRAPQHKWLPTAPGVCVHCCVCALGWVNADHKFRVWVSILGCMSHPFHFQVTPSFPSFTCKIVFCLLWNGRKPTVSLLFISSITCKAQNAKAWACTKSHLCTWVCVVMCVCISLCWLSDGLCKHMSGWTGRCCLHYPRYLVYSELMCVYVCI